MSATQRIADRIQGAYDAWAEGQAASPSDRDFILFATEEMGLAPVREEDIERMAEDLYDDTERDQMDAFEIAEWLVAELEASREVQS